MFSVLLVLIGITVITLSYYLMLLRMAPITMHGNPCINCTMARDKEEYLVPNIVHFIWFGKEKTMTFVNYISILSAYKIQKPEILRLHCDHLPVGDYWNRLQSEVTLDVVHHDPPKTIHGHKLSHVFHQGDVAKMEILLSQGGIYLDYDVIVLRSLNPLRRYNNVFGKEHERKLNAGVILAQSHSPFIQMWYESYRDYRPRHWDYNCAIVTYTLAQKHPDMVHVEEYKLTTPDWLDRAKLFRSTIDWRGMRVYCVHLMLHMDQRKRSPRTLEFMNNTIGDVIRYIYYGSNQVDFVNKTTGLL